jgi:hypothetical protein
LTLVDLTSFQFCQGLFSSEWKWSQFLQITEKLAFHGTAQSGMAEHIFLPLSVWLTRQKNSSVIILNLTTFQDCIVYKKLDSELIKTFVKLLEH